MWEIKTFDSEQQRQDWINKHPEMEVSIIFVNNGYGIEYRPYRIIDIQ